MMVHQPVLLKESIEGLNIRSGGIYVDLTYGSGGHSREILRRLGKGRLFAFDADRDAEKRVVNDKRFLFIRGNFRHAGNFLHYYKVDTIDGALGDLGVSSGHFDVAARGFSYRFPDSPLDMRMNRDADLSAFDVVNGYGPEELSTVLSRYGEFANAHRLSQRIIRMREHGNIRTVGELIGGLGDLIPGQSRNKYLARLFQAIRIEVNDELNALTEMMEAVTEMLGEGGRFCLISYHSLEDRLVKNFFRSGNFLGTLSHDLHGNTRLPYRLVSRGAVKPAPEEIEKNNRARSARLRIAERTIEQD